MYYTPPVLILGIDLKASKYRAINATLGERERSPFEVFENYKKWGISTKFLGVLKIMRLARKCSFNAVKSQIFKSVKFFKIHSKLFDL